MKNSANFSESILGETAEARPYLSGAGYRRLRRLVVLSTAAVAIVPLVIITLINYNQYEKALQDQTREEIVQLMTSNKRSLEFYLTERRSALAYIVRDRGFSELSDEKMLKRIARDLNASFARGAFVDLGLIDSKGLHLSYYGPYELKGNNYSDQEWFIRVSRKGVFTSDVFSGHRKSPHFAIAMRHELEKDDYYVLRATIDAEMLREQILTTGLKQRDDLFIINREGILQTPSRLYGNFLDTLPLDVPHPSREIKVMRYRDENDKLILISHASINDSPFILMFVRQNVHLNGNGILAEHIGFIVVSIALILMVILWGSHQFVRKIQSESLRRANLMHQVEYSEKLAVIGRLAASVAHEINNPLAIINENSGLIKDQISIQDNFPNRDKFLKLVDSVLGAVERCRKITHRLLGFAKRMDVQSETIDVPSLIKDVISFIGKEAESRNIYISSESQGHVPAIESDRGQLQQVFLNLLSNALNAVKDGGKISIITSGLDENRVRVVVSDNGVGIPRENLNRIFEPFFTTKEGSGTGLGLSITYGIVKKIGGDISVESEIGRGTSFIVVLPIKKGTGSNESN